ncbi:small-conductance mechanosensitive channel [Rheinheimera pacifica]|uniref:mechanosensitive ion channel family protein n=1 Tax=Rheinheimera pacifica TaxID=173990 RepID=UPI002856AFD2|nr:mechanosensitive ion channel domain-containing protein [Rheinheimera pacifica]MDR6985291.1 small-conductance mechanosensitive channel [Rheinheimera pacifica]
MTEKLLVWWQHVVTQLQQAELWYQLPAIVCCIVLAVIINRLVGRFLIDSGGEGLRHVAMRSSHRILLPFSLAALLAISSELFSLYQLQHNLIHLLIPIALALGMIRLLVYILRKGFSSGPLMKSVEPAVAVIIWLVVVLHLAGWLTPVLNVMDSLAFTLGESRFSLLSAVKLTLVIILAFTLALWLAELLNQQMKKAQHISPSMQVGFSKFSKFLLITIAFLIALNAVGINLSSLAVFGGALGVGLGFGLQRIASNFISGFILVLDRSIKPGDVISVGQNFGWVHELKARYVVVRNREGVDTLIPNENLITSEVINWSYEDRNVRVKIVVQVSYADDPEQAMALMLLCAKKSKRVLDTPEPTVMLKNFADNGIELELRVWIADPEYGADTVKSDINVAIWRAFKQEGITIPYPQRDLHIKSGQLPPTTEL